MTTNSRTMTVQTTGQRGSPMRLCDDHRERLATETADLDEERQQFAVDLIDVNFIDMLTTRDAALVPSQILGLVRDDAICPVCWTSQACSCEIENCADSWIGQAAHLANSKFDTVEIADAVVGGE